MLKYCFLEFFLEFAFASVNPYLQIMLRNKGFSQSLVGVVLAVGQIAALFMPIINGARIDATGRIKRRITSQAILLVLAFNLFAYCPDFVAIPLFVLGTGLCACLNPACDTYLTRNLNDPSLYGRIRAIGSLGYVTYLVIVPLAKFPLNTSNSQIVAAASVCMLLFTNCVYAAPRYAGKLKDEEKKLAEKKIFDFSWFDKSFYLLMTVIILMKIGFGVVEMLLGSYMTEVLNLGQKFTVFVSIASFSEIFALVFCGKLVKKNKITIWTLLFASCVAMSVRLLLYAFTKSIIVFVFAQCLHFFTFGCSHVAATIFISERVNKKHSSVAMALYWALGCYFTQFLCSIFGGFIIDKLGYDALFKIFAVFPFIAAVICFKGKKILEEKN